MIFVCVFSSGAVNHGPLGCICYSYKVFYPTSTLLHVCWNTATLQRKVGGDPCTKVDLLEELKQEQILGAPSISPLRVLDLAL